MPASPRPRQGLKSAGRSAGGLLSVACSCASVVASTLRMRFCGGGPLILILLMLALVVLLSRPTDAPPSHVRRGDLVGTLCRLEDDTQRRIRKTLGAPDGFSSCAIVGSAGMLREERLGAEIDKHEFVIRENLEHIVTHTHTPCRCSLGAHGGRSSRASPTYVTALFLHS